MENAQEALASFISENEESIAMELERRYVQDYPFSRSNQMDSSYVHQWTIDTLNTLATALVEDDPSRMSYRNAFGDALEDPHEPRLSLFTSNLSSMLFMGRVIAPSIMQIGTQSPAAPTMRDRTEMVGALEQFLQRSIANDCETFSREISQPGILQSSWQLAPSAPHGSAFADTPARRFLGVEHASMLKKNATDVSSEDEITAFANDKKLSARERDVLRLVAEGKSNGEIAAALKLSQNTVKNHVSHIFDKSNVNSRVELISLILSGEGD